LSIFDGHLPDIYKLSDLCGFDRDVSGTSPGRNPEEKMVAPSDSVLLSSGAALIDWSVFITGAIMRPH
jgi:hypothetical protein